MPNQQSSLRIKLPGLRVWFIIIAAVIVLCFLTLWLIKRSTHVSTDDARVAADMIDIRSKTAGLIEDVYASSGDIFSEDQVIAQLEKLEVSLHLQELQSGVEAKAAQISRAEAELNMVTLQTSGGVQGVESKLRASKSKLAAEVAEYEFKSSEWKRAKSLRERKIISERDWENTRNAHRHAEQALQQAQADVVSVTAALSEAHAAQQRIQVLAQGIVAAKHERQSLVLAADQAQVRLQDRAFKAPSAGVIDRVFVDAGEYVVPGQRVLLMHDPDTVSINANIKETEVRHLKVDQPVAISVDAYPDEVFKGRVEKIGDAATSQFSLLPSTNPSGNFTKVTQRISVKIAVEQRENLLKPGMMVEVDIYVGGG